MTASGARLGVPSACRNVQSAHALASIEDRSTMRAIPTQALVSSSTAGVIAALPVAAAPATAPARVRRAAFLTRRAMGVTLAALGGAVTAVYVVVCSYMALTLTRPERVPFTKSPEQFGLAYESVTFPSRDDHLTLDGWYLPAAPTTSQATPKRPVIVVHGKSSDRQRVTREHNALPIAAHLTKQGHPVLLFDL